METISHILLQNLWSCGFFNEIVKQYSTTLHFHKTSERDALDMISIAIDNCNYYKSLELKEFLGKLNRCVRSALLRLATLCEFSQRHLTLTFCRLCIFPERCWDRLEDRLDCECARSSCHCSSFSASITSTSLCGSICRYAVG